MIKQIGLAERRTTMPRRILLLIIAIAWLWTPTISKAQENLHELKHGFCIPDCIRKWCCDDYCPKPIPCPVNLKCFGCDCYQAKCAPCPVGVKCFRCDDYCPKPLPCIFCPPNCHLKCAPPLRYPSPERVVVSEIGSKVSDDNSRGETSDSRSNALAEDTATSRRLRR